MKYSGKAAGSYGALGGTIEFVWVPDPAEVANDILRLADALDDVFGPLAISKDIARDDVARRFKLHEDPEGNPWVEWSESYKPYALRNNLGGILEQSLGLRQAATARSAFIIGDDSVFFDTGTFDMISTKKDPEGDRWIWHQEGRSRGGEGPSQEQIAEEARFLGVNHNVAKITLQARMGGGVKNELPARPFLGLSFEAEIQILEVFDQWFEGVISLGFGRKISASGMVVKGKAFPRHSKRGSGGRFVPKAL